MCATSALHCCFVPQVGTAPTGTTAGATEPSAESKEAAGTTTTTAAAPAATDSTAAAADATTTVATIGKKLRPEPMHTHVRVRLMTSGNPDEFRSCLPEDLEDLPKPGTWAFAKVGEQWKRFSVDKYCLIREMTYLGVSTTC
jgi:hypothetical protein